MKWLRFVRVSVVGMLHPSVFAYDISEWNITINGIEGRGKHKRSGTTIVAHNVANFYKGASKYTYWYNQLIIYGVSCTDERVCFFYLWSIERFEILYA